ncbi:hypothetical protein M427DRAFT_75366 [Gonapodya prolifera JEL478]|uniref:Zn(2)-C6 fungal-type domain-containing protein n=1 Tax=Gonapodya prolifera (strain JEL478) TaxID=1344416 RepID=A0A138ZY95_GONPJ|nr:hypothetical protein M427DRAFT_75366 [Gonapodya prolifera JEL478]|eukprot:KXS09478.1 hypothetical protein M427DRAFT_75366 [Gonapodya prolifera JEL478]
MASSKVRMACDWCHSGKRKCDGRQPCSSCLKQHRQCNYTIGKPRKLLGRQEYIRMLESQLQTMRAAVAAADIHGKSRSKSMSDGSDAGLAERVSAEPSMHESSAARSAQPIGFPGLMDTGSSSVLGDGVLVGTRRPSSEVVGSRSVSPTRSWTSSPFPKDFSFANDPMDFLGNFSAFDGAHASSLDERHSSRGGAHVPSLDERQSSRSISGSPRDPGVSDGSALEDLLTRVIRLRNDTTYFGPAVKARRRETDKLRECMLNLEDHLAKLAAQTPDPSSVLQAYAVPMADATGNEVDMDTVLVMMEKLRMNPEPVNMRMMRNLVPAEPPLLDLLAQFFDIFWFPSIHPGTFFRAIDHQSPLLLYAMYAFSTTISHRALVSPEWSQEAQTGDATVAHPAEMYFIRARRLLTIAFDEPSLSTAFALLLMSMYSAGAGMASSGWMYSGMAVRMLIEMKWNVGDPSHLTPLELETRKRAWWFCFIFSTSTSICADRPTFVEPSDGIGMMGYPDDDVWNSLDDNGELANIQSHQGPVLLRHHLAAGSSRNSPSAPPATSNGFGQLAVSRHFREISEAWVLLQQIYKYVKDEKVPKTAIGMLDPRLSALDKQIKAMWAQLPETAQQEFVPAHPPTLDNIKQLTSNACLHITLHCCTIKLHRPEIALGDIVWPTSTSLKTCTHSAERVAQILEKILMAEPSFAHVSTVVGSGIFEAGMVHATNVYLHSLPHGFAEPNRSTADQSIADSFRYFSICLLALDKLRRYWASAEAFHSSLLITAQELKVAEIVAGRVPS